MEENKFNQIIKSDSISLVSDLTEISLDTFISDETIKDIPIIGTITKLLSIGRSINDRIFTGKLIHFLKELDGLDEDFILKEIQYIDDSKNISIRLVKK